MESNIVAFISLLFCSTVFLCRSTWSTRHLRYFSAHVIHGHLTCRAHPLLSSPCVSWLRGQALQLPYLPVCGPPDPRLVCDAGCLLWATCELRGCSWPWDALRTITQCCNAIPPHPHQWQNQAKCGAVKNNAINPQSYAAMRFVCEIPTVWKGLRTGIKAKNKARR